QFRVQVQALARLNRHFFLAFAWHKVAPWPSVYASHTKVRIGSRWVARMDNNRDVWKAGKAPLKGFLLPFEDHRATGTMHAQVTVPSTSDTSAIA
ncbi:hypothetical protein, partial [Burkholderia ambifaria]|uniref:hypothetical protein n=1 Tax=Burkholderia ambifaria TaxID=152480 RepID=UPI001ABA2AF6